MIEDQRGLIQTGRRWTDRTHQAAVGNWGIREILRAIGRRKKVALLAFLAVAAAIATGFQRYYTYEAVCLIAVKKPSELFVPVGQLGAASNVSVPLLEGQTYKYMVESMAFAGKVAAAIEKTGLHLNPDDVSTRLQVKFYDPDLLQIKAKDENPDVAVRIANTAARILVDYNQNELRTELKAQVDTITRLLREADDGVKSAQSALADYIEQKKMVNVSSSTGVVEFTNLLNVLSQNEIALAKDEAALKAAEGRLKRLKLQQTEPVSAAEVVVEDPVVASLKSQIEELKKNLSEAEQYYTEMHPKVQGVRVQLAKLQGELDKQLEKGQNPRALPSSTEHQLAFNQALNEKIAEANKEETALRAQTTVWSRLINEQRRILDASFGKQGEFERLKLAVTFAEERYRTLARKLDDTHISLDAIKGTLSIVQPTTKADPPDTRRIILLISFLLIVLPLGIALALDFMDDTIQSPAVFNQQAGMFCLATVPKTRSIRTSNLLTSGDSKGNDYAGDNLRAFQILRSGLYFASSDRPSKMIAIVSSRRREGRSSMVLHLANALVKEQKSVAIVDADLHHSNLAQMLGLKSSSGLVEVLTGERTMEEALLKTTPLKAAFLPTKATDRALPPNAELLFRTPQFERMVKDLSSYDVVLFDTPPILDFADTLELLPHMDSVIIVAEAGNTTPEDMQRTQDLVRLSGVTNLGVILNKTRKGW